MHISHDISKDARADFPQTTQGMELLHYGLLAYAGREDEADQSEPIGAVDRVELNMSDQRGFMALFESELSARGMSIVDMAKLASVASNSFYAWRTGGRTPLLRNAVAIAEAFGFEVIMRGVRLATGEYNMRDQGAAMSVLLAERKSRRMSLGDMEEKSGVSVNSVYAWLSCKRSPSLCNAVAIAETFGFEIVMRRKVAPL